MITDSQSNGILDRLKEQKLFIGLISIGFLVSAVVVDDPSIAMWVGFLFAGYSAVANDSIQTIGTFIASNKDQKWWKLFIWIGGIFLATVWYSWTTFNGDVSYERLTSKGFDKAPESFHFLQLAAPLFLIILTRLKMPVSTTFLLLSCFAATGKSLGAVVLKSLSGYVIAFMCSLLLWGLLSPWMKKKFVGQAHPGWRVAQWITTGTLWSVWLQQDAANIAVFLPRSLSALEFALFAGVILVGLAFLFSMGGERIQEIVEEKSTVTDVRAGTVIDGIYAIILYIFKIHSKVPMSTTWVFVGLLAGREIAMNWRKAGKDGRTVKDALRLAGRDLLFVTIGFVISVVLAALSNPAIADALFSN